ncbi:acetoacetyl-CoA synthase [Thermaerobacter marianensis DSM 12885]|uniref:Acetoacetyl-CoA synthase n=1 Tax=Thermaerobacter marianensis (strain ATCC 700841 / DSM 12885 / JCM 10246 / 7p75a) TaxID=644966 RepID=E6SJ65_THEM7|nr:acetoacetate--CoA ligase [Thermaerobacter marianensis]ADU52089.1 acetoacetyl-CoA synthase [Thermaerobacter marianensis DSM 12885]
MAAVSEGTLLWTPSDEFQRRSRMRHYMDWLAQHRGLRFETYDALWQWSVRDLEGFWSSLWEYFDIQASSPYEKVLASREMPGAKWFPGARLNYAEHALRVIAGRAAHGGAPAPEAGTRGRDAGAGGSEAPALVAVPAGPTDPNGPAVMFQSELRSLSSLSWSDLAEQVAAVATGLRELGVRPGDRVVAYVPNIPEALVAFLATASLGAIWSSCSPDFGAPSVADRFRQIEPKVLFAVDGYRYGGRDYDRRPVVAELQRQLPTLEATILIPYLDPDRTGGGGGGTGAGGMAGAGFFPGRTLPWSDLLRQRGPLTFEQVPFDHPLWVLYSSGTTGLPKPIVQGHGGILLEHLKMLALHSDLGPGDRFFWFTTTGWMMWNFLISGLLVGATVLLYDGSPGFPDMNALWRFAAATRMNLFGTSAAYITHCMKAGIEPGRDFDLSALKCVGSTGSPLSPEGFQWVYDHVKRDLWLASVSGGTDVCTAFVGGCPLLPVHAGEIQCRCLGADVQAFDEEGRPVVDQVGELVITQPMPSMPLFFWNDPGGQRYRESYFEMFPGVWRHGDWIKITRRGSAVIYGRSDSTINRQGVRMGTSEIYRVVEDIPEVLDSLVVDLELPGRGPYMPLFVVLREGVELDDALRERIRRRIRESLSPRHVPDEIVAVPEVPRTLNGKKLEVPIKKILMGAPREKAVNPDSMSNPGSLAFFEGFAQRLRS